LERGRLGRRGDLSENDEGRARRPALFRRGVRIQQLLPIGYQLLPALQPPWPDLSHVRA